MTAAGPPSAAPPLVRLVRLGHPVAPALLADSVAVLSDAERAAADGLRTAEARDLSVVARATLRRLLSAVVPTVAAADWAFAPGPHGKPLVVGPAVGHALHASVSHTPGLVACVVSAAGPVGIDAEYLARFARTGGPTPLLSPPERAELDALAPADRPRRMADIWTAKEAYAKAIGKGVHAALRQVTVHAAATRPTLGGPVADLRRWHLHRLNAGPHHVAVLATECVRPPAVTTQ